MKSKSYDLKRSTAEKSNKTLDFVGLYKTAAESEVKLVETQNSTENTTKVNTKSNILRSKHDRTPYKIKKKGKQDEIDISHINIDGSSLVSQTGGSTPLNEFKVTSTPNNNDKRQGKVKSIMKHNSINNDDSMDGSKVDMSTSNPKKRNKSVSFMLDDNEEVLPKKTKSDDSLNINNKNDTCIKSKLNKVVKKNFKKLRKEHQAEKENKGSENQSNTLESRSATKKTKTKFVDKSKKSIDIEKSSTIPTDENHTENNKPEKKRNFKKAKKSKSKESSDLNEKTDKQVDQNVEIKQTTSSGNNQMTETKNKKAKKKKRQTKSQTETVESEDEPASKNRKKDIKPDLIAEDLENLSIGENAHTLSNLLDEMTVVDKDKRKKLRQKFNKNKKQRASIERFDKENDNSTEKVKWRKNWNKIRKSNVDENVLEHSVVVENLPLSIIFTYKKLLADYFGKFGLIQKIGVAEVYSTEESEPVFTTTINFYSDGAAEKALEENLSDFEGSKIHVKRSLPPTETTIVVRSYAPLTDQAISSVFVGAGRIRNIRQLIKGKKAIASAFVEFDGPEAVQQAIKMASGVKIGGKKIHVSKFEYRKNKEKMPKNEHNSSEGEDSENTKD